MSLRLLAIDTATEACSAALWIDGEIRERYEVAGREHTQRLMQQVSALMADAGLSFQQLDGIAADGRKIAEALRERCDLGLV